jgi:2-oxoisovalerate dehydrogenase E1 component beta subunit
LAGPGGVDAEVIDLKSLIPYDIECLVESVNRTGRLVIIHEATQTLGFGAELAAELQQRCFGYLQAPIDRVCAPDVPYSYRVGDDYCKPGEKRIRVALRKIMEYAF